MLKLESKEKKMKIKEVSVMKKHCREKQG